MDEKLQERIQDERLFATAGMLTSYAEDLEDRLRDGLCDAAEERAEKRVLREELERLQTKLMTQEELMTQEKMTIRVRELETERDQLQQYNRRYRVELRAALANLSACRQKGRWISDESDVLFHCSECETQISTSWDYDDL